jgi:hypothetical protein
VTVRGAAALGLLAALAVSGAAHAGETIRDFSADVFVQDDGNLSVVERIRYDFGDAERHGIYREIPLRGGEGFGEAHTISITVDDVTDEAGKPRTWKLEGGGGLVRVRIGDADRTVRGLHEYRIHYRVKRAFRFFPDRDELAWNATGNEWKVPIEHAEARVYLPERAIGKVHPRCFSGRYGSRASDCTAQDDGSTIGFAAADLPPAAGLTAVVDVPKGILPEPSPFQRWVEWAVEQGGFWLLAPCAVFLLCFRLWRSYGVDDGGGEAVPVRYEPPEGLSPAEVGTLLDERADLADLSSTLLDLAVRGYLEIQEVESSRFLFLGSKDYVLKKKREADDLMRGHERAFHGALFAGRDVVRVSSLRQKFHEEVENVRSLVYAQLSGKDGCFRGSPESVRTRYKAGAFVLAVAAILLGGTALVPPLGVACLLASAAIVFLFAPAMPSRTTRGRRLYLEILGYREFLQRVDRDRLERMGGRTTDRFETGLAYAMVLGVADRWADAFSDLYAKPPDWYRSDSYRGGFASRHFVSDVGRSLNTIGRSLAESPPARSSSSGGGGGFSGGGSGGGGGGSW